MVEAVNHDLASGTATTLWGGAKGGIKGALGALLIPVVGAGLGIGLAVGVGYLAFTLGAAVWAATAIGAVTGTALFAASAVVGSAALPWMAGAGGVLGLFSGKNRVSEESLQYQRAVENRALAGMSKVDYARNVGRQEGAAMVDHLYQQRMAQIAAQMGPQQEKSWTKTEDQRRAAPAASPQVG